MGEERTWQILCNKGDNNSSMFGKNFQQNCNSPVMSGLEILANQQTMSTLIQELTGQPFVLPVMLTSTFNCIENEVN